MTGVIELPRRHAPFAVRRAIALLEVALRHWPGVDGVQISVDRTDEPTVHLLANAEYTGQAPAEEPRR